jgi:hypothetical protein
MPTLSIRSMYLIQPQDSVFGACNVVWLQTVVTGMQALLRHGSTPPPEHMPWLGIPRSCIKLCVQGVRLPTAAHLCAEVKSLARRAHWFQS